jgi:DNA-directed RNA polymerase specialized sigma24 family protein
VGDGDAATRLEGAEVGRIFREESGRSLAALIRAFGDIDIAEDAVQEAFAVALGRWPHDGVPPNPGGWITTTARNHAIDRLRREARGRELLSEVAVLSPGSDDPGKPEVGPVPDDRLRLIFTCCHPALSTQAQMALTLRLLGGLSTRQVASSLSVRGPPVNKGLAGGNGLLAPRCWPCVTGRGRGQGGAPAATRGPNDLDAGEDRCRIEAARRGPRVSASGPPPGRPRVVVLRWRVRGGAQPYLGPRTQGPVT